MRNRKRSARINPISAMDMDGLSSGSPPRIFWNSRKRPDKGQVGLVQAKPTNEKSEPMETDKKEELNRNAELSEKRKALFEPLSPTNHKRRISNEDLLPPPDFHDLDYPKGWLIGKKRKLVNVDVVESMRRIAVQEMNRKDGEIDVLNEQLEDDSRVLQHLQSQLVEEKRKRTEAERENQMLQDQVSVLTGMLEEHGPLDGEELPFEEDDLDGHDQDPPALQ